MGVFIETDNELIKIKSDYNKNFIKRVKQLNGTWNPPYWVVPSYNRDALIDLLMDVYGECGSLKQVERCLFEIDLEKYNFDKSEPYIKFNTLLLVSRDDRDADVKLHNGTSIISGGFPGHGGSKKYPMISTPSPNTKLCFYAPVEWYNGQDGVSVVSDDNSYINVLKQERTNLLHRIDEIDQILQQYERGIHNEENRHE